MSVPCKDCLVLAACKNKKNIQCDPLHMWLLNHEFEDYEKLLPFLSTMEGLTVECSVNTEKMYKLCVRKMKEINDMINKEDGDTWFHKIMKEKKKMKMNAQDAT